MDNYRLRLYYKKNLLKSKLHQQNITLLEQVQIMKRLLDIKRELNPTFPKIRNVGSGIPSFATVPLTGYGGGHRGDGFILC